MVRRKKTFICLFILLLTAIFVGGVVFYIGFARYLVNSKFKSEVASSILEYEKGNYNIVYASRNFDTSTISIIDKSTGMEFTITKKLLPRMIKHSPMDFDISDCSKALHGVYGTVKILESGTVENIIGVKIPFAKGTYTLDGKRMLVFGTIFTFNKDGRNYLINLLASNLEDKYKEVEIKKIINKILTHNK